MTATLATVSRTANHRLVPPAGAFEIDPVHTFVTFRAQHLVIGRVRGRFEKVSGEITVADDVLASHVEVSIDAASVNTGMPMRDDDLRSPSFLDVAQYPHLTFASTAITELPAGQWAVTGDLTIRGITRPTELLVEFGGSTLDPFGNLRSAFSATTTISRRDYGLVYDLVDQGGSLLVGRDIIIEIDAEATHPL